MTSTSTITTTGHGVRNRNLLVIVIDFSQLRVKPECLRMLHYFYLLDSIWMTQSLQPALSASWRQRNFAPCTNLCSELVARQPIPEDALIRAVARGMGYDRTLWHALIDECLIFGALAMPQIPCMLDALLWLLAPERRAADRSERSTLSPIEQVYRGAHDLSFAGGWHRPEQIGWNDPADVTRLSAYLNAIDVKSWTAAALAPVANLSDAAERTEELLYILDWWPELVRTYSEAASKWQVIVCETP